MKPQHQKSNIERTKALETIFIAGLIAGILDSAAASTVFYLKFGLNPAQVMQFIASAIFGSRAFTGGTPMVLIGILLHFLISFVVAALYFFCYPKMVILGKKPVLSGLSLGLVTWLVMNLLVIPLSNIQPAPSDPVGIIISITWHMLFIGLPISFLTRRHFYTSPV